jgi:hypothetical protein
VKPWKLARGLEISVTDSIKHVTRLMDSSPMIASKCTTAFRTKRESGREKQKRSEERNGVLR